MLAAVPTVVFEVTMIWSERPKPGIFSEPVRNSIRLPRQIRENHIKDSSSYLI